MSDAGLAGRVAKVSRAGMDMCRSVDLNGHQTLVLRPCEADGGPEEASVGSKRPESDFIPTEVLKDMVYFRSWSRSPEAGPDGHFLYEIEGFGLSPRSGTVPAGRAVLPKIDLTKRRLPEALPSRVLSAPGRLF